MNKGKEEMEEGFLILALFERFNLTEKEKERGRKRKTKNVFRSIRFLNF